MDPQKIAAICGKYKSEIQDCSRTQFKENQNDNDKADKTSGNRSSVSRKFFISELKHFKSNLSFWSEILYEILK